MEIRLQQDAPLRVDFEEAPSLRVTTTRSDTPDDIEALRVLEKQPWGWGLPNELDSVGAPHLVCDARRLYDYSIRFELLNPDGLPVDELAFPPIELEAITRPGSPDFEIELWAGFLLSGTLDHAADSYY